MLIIACTADTKTQFGLHVFFYISNQFISNFPRNKLLYKQQINFKMRF